jgi:hypothetical protein
MLSKGSINTTVWKIKIIGEFDYSTNFCVLKKINDSCLIMVRWVRICFWFFSVRQVAQIILNESSKSTENALFEWLGKETTRVILWGIGQNWTRVHQNPWKVWFFVIFVYFLSILTWNIDKSTLFLKISVCILWKKQRESLIADTRHFFLFQKTCYDIFIVRKN